MNEQQWPPAGVKWYYKDDAVTLYHGDCREIVESERIGPVDLVLVDPPYGTTAIKWDSAIPVADMWSIINSTKKASAAILIFSSQPFTTDLISSNRKMFKYEIIWHKSRSQGFLNANKAPLRAHENICVFYSKMPTYNVIKHEAKKLSRKIGAVRQCNEMRSQQYRKMNRTEFVEDGTRWPTDVLFFNNPNQGSLHPTQKPLALCIRLIEMYTNTGETVFDFTAGSGTTGLAAKLLGRKCVMVEKDEKYCEIAASRCRQEVLPLDFATERNTTK